MNLLIVILNLLILEESQIPREINIIIIIWPLDLFRSIITCISCLGKKAAFPLWATLLPLQVCFSMFAKLTELSQDINREVLLLIKINRAVLALNILHLVTKGKTKQNKQNQCPIACNLRTLNCPHSWSTDQKTAILGKNYTGCFSSM